MTTLLVDNADDGTTGHGSSEQEVVFSSNKQENVVPLQSSKQQNEADQSIILVLEDNL